MNDLINDFKSFLISQKRVSAVTAKNYVSDINKFLNWYSTYYENEFSAEDINDEVITLFQNQSNSNSPRSTERYISTLRKFTKYLKDKSLIDADPFDEISKTKVRELISSDPWDLKNFKNHLYQSGASALTMKNYMVDINAFTTWLSESAPKGKDNNPVLDPQTIEIYKERLASILGLSPSSINRKLSSIRRYISFVSGGTTHSQEAEPLRDIPSFVNPTLEEIKNPEANSGVNLEEIKSVETPVEDLIKFSPFPPLRLLQKLFLPYLILEEKVATKIANGINLSKLNDKISSNSGKSGKVLATYVKSYSKQQYSPQTVSLVGLPLYKQILHHASYSRPKWYLSYHKYTVAHYLHVAVLMIYASVLGYIIYTGLFAPQTQKALASSVAPPRILSFQGRLTDKNDAAITQPTNIRFTIYNDTTATGAGHLVWQEVDQVIPDENGVFNELLGDGAPCLNQPLAVQKTPCTIPNNLFTDNSRLFLGITVEDTDELAPRQQLATVAYAANSESLQGMRPITDTTAGTSNVVLALDSSGNLTIGGKASPTFQATGGQFKISGQPLILTTNASTNADIQVAPDGLGRIDLQKPIINSTNAGSIPGAVEVDDQFAVIATTSAAAAFIVDNHTSGGDIFAASSSGTLRFLIQNNGDLSLSPGVSIDTISTGTLSIGSSNATTIKIGRAAQGINLPNFTGQNGALYGSYATGDLGQATTSTSGLCLISGASNPSWGTCTGAVSSNDLFWNQTNGLLYPNNTTADFVIGGQSTSSAKFAIFNVNSSGPVTASISGNLIIQSVNGAGGNVGIGTNDPQVALQINSAANTNVLRLQDADGTCDHNPQAGSETVTCSSDERLKTDIVDSGDTLSDLSKLRIREYTVKTSGNRLTGVIAQEVQNVFPEMVHTGSNGYLMVEEPSIWKVVKAIQELYAAAAATTQNFVNVIAQSVNVAGSLTTNSLAVATNSVTIAGQSLSDYIQQVVKQTISSTGSLADIIPNSNIVSPLASANQVETNVISPLAADSNISLGLNNSELEIHSSRNATESATVASIDNKGNVYTQGDLAARNATLSGNLTADNLNASYATISGTLYANNIQANSIQGLDSRIQNILGSTNTSTPSGQYVSNYHETVAQTSGGFTDMANIMTGQAKITNIDYVDVSNFNADFGTFRQGLISLGPATFGQVTANDGIWVGTTLMIGSNSIDTLGQDLEIEPLRQGAVSFLAGAVRIETDGTLKVAGNAEIAGDLSVKGRIRTNIISPLPDSDLLIKNSSDAAILAINSIGNVVASGSGTFNKLNLSFAAPAYAISDTEVVATGSAGTAAIKQYSGELTIYDSQVTDKSLIYITPTGSSNNEVLYLLRQEAGLSFTVGIDRPATQDIKFNWIIVN